MNALTNLSDIQFIPVDQLNVSKLNVRKQLPNDQDHIALKNDIASKGLLMPLYAYAENDQFHIAAGQRRFRAIEALCADGSTLFESGIPCIVTDKNSAISISLAENNHKEMTEYDYFMAFKAMRKLGIDETDIAQRSGVDLNEVRKYLAITNVHATILKSFKSSEIDLDTVKLFTIVSKREQGEIYAGIHPYVTAHRVKQAIDNLALVSSSRIGRAVDRNVYTAKGGKLREDMFSEEVLYIDSQLAVSTIEAKLEAIRETLLKEGWSKVETSLDHISTHDYFRERGRLIKVPPELNIKLKSQKEELERCEESEEYDDDWSGWDKLEAAIADTEREIENYRQFSKKIKEHAICAVYLDHTGSVVVERGLLSTKMKKQMEKSQARSNSNDEPTTEPDTDTVEISNTLKDSLRLFKRQLIQQAVMNNPVFALDTLVYRLYQGYALPFEYGQHAQIQLNSNMDYAESHATVALDAMHKRLEIVRADWDDLSVAERFSYIQGLALDEKMQLIALFTSCSIQAASIDHEFPGASTIEPEIDWKQWQPTAENFFKRLRRPMLVSIGESVFGSKWASTCAKNSVGDIAAELDQYATDNPEWLPSAFVELS